MTFSMQISLTNFSKCFLAIFFTTTHIGRAFGETTIYFMEMLWKNGHFSKILARISEFLSHAFFFASFYFEIEIFGLNLFSIILKEYL